MNFMALNFDDQMRIVCDRKIVDAFKDRFPRHLQCSNRHQTKIEAEPDHIAYLLC